MVFLPPTADLALYLNGLSLLFNVYLSQKPGVASKLGEFIEELKRLSPSAQSQTRAELDRRLEEKLLPEVGRVETEAVKRDLDLVAVFSEPIRVQDFDYLSTLSTYGSKYASLADKASLFDLRGAGKNTEWVLWLPTAGSRLVEAKNWNLFVRPSVFPNNLSPVKVRSFDAVLAKAGTDYELRFSVIATFDRLDRMSYNSHNVELGCIYNLKNEERKNWVKLEPRSATEGFESISMRLDASTVFEFMKAVRADVMKYVSDLNEEKSLIQGGISSLLREVSQFFERTERLASAPNVKD